MITSTPPRLKSIGCDLDTDPSAFGELEDSSSLVGNAPALRERMAEEGYLFIRGFFPRKVIETARQSMLEALAPSGIFDSDRPIAEGVLKPGVKIAFAPEAAEGNPDVRRVIFGPEVRNFYETFLGGHVRHFDFIWVRAIGMGHGTKPHCDIVYMGRGTHELYTAWIPYGDVSYSIGGLMILENSHLHGQRLRNYLSLDVDTYCENNPTRNGAKFGGFLSKNPASLQKHLGGRWLSAEYQMGDLLTFRVNTVHASIDNQTNCVRLSTDTRYQLASEPADERWIGDNPIAHGLAAKRGRIC